MNSEKNTYFITGASGLVGSYITKRLLEANQKVIALKRKNTDLGLLSKTDQEKITWIEGDILDIDSLQKGISQANRVVHAAAFISFRAKHAEKLLKINVEGTANVVNVCLQNQVSQLCYLSSIAALGQNYDSKIAINEKTQYDTENRASQYGFSKYLAEQEVWRGVAEGLNAFAINPSVVLGVGDWDKSSLLLLKMAYKNIGFYPKGTLNIVDVRDLAEIVWQLFQNPTLGNQRYIVSSQNLSYYDFLAETALRFEKKPPTIALKNWNLQAFYWISQILSAMRLLPPVVTSETIDAVQRNIIYDNSLIIKSLNFQYRALKDTLDWVCEAFVKNLE